MHNQAMESNSHKNSLSHTRNMLSSQESPSRLEFMIAFLLEKNERMRQQLTVRDYEEHQ
jgi:hypothetical protein